MGELVSSVAKQPTAWLRNTAPRPSRPRSSSQAIVACPREAESPPRRVFTVPPDHVTEPGLRRHLRSGGHSNSVLARPMRWASGTVATISLEQVRGSQERPVPAYARHVASRRAKCNRDGTLHCRMRNVSSDQNVQTTLFSTRPVSGRDDGWWVHRMCVGLDHRRVFCVGSGSFPTWSDSRTG